MKKYSLFIGRWEPWHAGHEKLIRTVLDEGKNVCIAIRDTEKSKENPYSVEERRNMICACFAKEIFIDKSVRITVIPDITEVCYGRKVGWGIREIRLAEETEKISATRIRGGNE